MQNRNSAKTTAAYAGHLPHVLTAGSLRTSQYAPSANITHTTATKNTTTNGICAPATGYAYSTTNTLSAASSARPNSSIPSNAVCLVATNHIQGGAAYMICSVRSVSASASTPTPSASFTAVIIHGAARRLCASSAPSSPRAAQNGTPASIDGAQYHVVPIEVRGLKISDCTMALTLLP